MIAIDTSSFIAYLSGDHGRDVEAVDAALATSQACLPPVVLTELLSDPKLTRRLIGTFKELPLLPITEGYWERAGGLRAAVLATGRKARLADTLITQCCLDSGVPLITRDADFASFARACPLRLVT
jgi:predicted nucleic acid-binding protein